jgi:hypothetical protein
MGGGSMTKRDICLHMVLISKKTWLERTEALDYIASYDAKRASRDEHTEHTKHLKHVAMKALGRKK